ncbi:MAG: hypothetical protein HC859_11080 [Bacteroidia bacterium]|nr:hypothetical protein [Bacteroidia bacterium]
MRRGDGNFGVSTYGTCKQLEDSRMNRIVVLGVAAFFALVGIALIGGEKFGGSRPCSPAAAAAMAARMIAAAATAASIVAATAATTAARRRTAAAIRAMAASAADENKSMYDWLLEMYVEFGYYKEHLLNITKKGQQGEQEIKAMMEKLRTNPPTELIGSAVVRQLDYKTSEEKNLDTGAITKIDLPSSDVLQFYLADGTKISARPSGTEPKIKFYISVNAPLPSRNSFDAVDALLTEK